MLSVNKMEGSYTPRSPRYSRSMKSFMNSKTYKYGLLTIGLICLALASYFTHVSLKEYPSDYTQTKFVKFYKSMSGRAVIALLWLMAVFSIGTFTCGMTK